MEIKITIPGTPIAKKRPRFVRRGKFVQTYNCQETEEGKFIILARQQIPDMAPAGEPVELICRFVFPIPASASKRQRREIEERGYSHVKKPDADNCLKFIKDCLNSVAWHDDSQVYLVVVRKEYGEQPRTELLIRWEKRISHVEVASRIRTGNVMDL